MHNQFIILLKQFIQLSLVYAESIYTFASYKNYSSNRNFRFQAHTLVWLHTTWTYARVTTAPYFPTHSLAHTCVAHPCVSNKKSVSYMAWTHAHVLVRVVSIFKTVSYMA